MVTAAHILGTDVGSTSPAFLAVLAVHVVAGLTAVITGAIAALSRKGGSRHRRAGRTFYWTISLVFITATILATMRWRQDYHLFLIGAIAFTAATIGFLHRRWHRPGDTGHILGMGIGYIAMLTAFYVDNGPHLPLWDKLPSLTFWFLPAAVGSPIIARAVVAARRRALIVRPAQVQDVAQMARVVVRCWQETYRGLVSDAVLDDPGFPAARERMWTTVLTDDRYRQNRVAVAERQGVLVGVAMSGPPEDVTVAWTRHLYVLYVHAADHGTGAGQALLEAVTDPAESVALWVADPNPRAQAFYRKHGFVPDGAVQVEDGMREIRMIRDVRHRRRPTRVGTCLKP